MDYLDRFLQLADFDATISKVCKFDQNWSVEESQQNHGIFHIITKGSGSLLFENKIFALEQGDIVFLPHGTQHLVTSHHLWDTAASWQGHEYDYHELTPEQLKTVQAQAFQDNPKVTLHNYGDFTLFSHNSEYSDFDMICGEINGDYNFFHHLPPFIILKNKQHNTHGVISLVKSELSNGQMGAQTILRSLVHTLFIYALRHGDTDSPVRSSILALYQKPNLTKVVNAILDEPLREWRINELASLAGMSRAQFFRSFKAYTNMLPKPFMMQVRMMVAKRWLRSTIDSVSSIAHRLGFKREGSFAKAFIKAEGITPQDYRKRSACDGNSEETYQSKFQAYANKLQRFNDVWDEHAYNEYSEYDDTEFDEEYDHDYDDQDYPEYDDHHEQVQEYQEPNQYGPEHDNAQEYAQESLENAQAQNKATTAADDQAHLASIHDQAAVAPTLAEQAEGLPTLNPHAPAHPSHLAQQRKQGQGQPTPVSHFETQSRFPQNHKEFDAKDLQVDTLMQLNERIQDLYLKRHDRRIAFEAYMAQLQPQADETEQMFRQRRIYFMGRFYEEQLEIKQEILYLENLRRGLPQPEARPQAAPCTCNCNQEHEYDYDNQPPRNQLFNY